MNEQRKITVDVRRRDVLAVAAGAAAVSALPSSVHGAEGPADFQADVIVVGSGAAGSVAALYAKAAGARVILLEKTGHYGGTSSKSGGDLWIPNNFDLKRQGLDDPKPDFLRYAVRVSCPSSYDPQHPTLGASEFQYRLLETFYDQASPMIEGLRSAGWLALKPFLVQGNAIPDYYANLPENKRKAGRILCPDPGSSDGSAGGDELMLQLGNAVRSAGIQVHMQTAATALLRNSEGRVTGLQAETSDGRKLRLACRRGVVFATGGFPHNKDLLDRFHNRPVFGTCALPGSTGDFVAMAEGAGASLGNMFGGWRGQVVLDDALRLTSVPSVVFFTPLDSMIAVNKYGLRCGNEYRSYHERAKTHYRWDANRSEYPNLIQFMIYDHRSAVTRGGFMPCPPAPTGADYVVHADTLEDLARKIDEKLAAFGAGAANTRLDANFVEALKHTISRFNGFCATGKDEDFERGGTPLEQGFDIPLPPGSPWNIPKKNPALCPIADKGPYYCIILAPGVLDTNGGPVIDPEARVISGDGQPIAGLYGAGNCIASPSGDSYYAAGATLAMAMTFGMIAGKNAAANAPVMA